MLINKLNSSQRFVKILATERKRNYSPCKFLPTYKGLNLANYNLIILADLLPLDPVSLMM